METLEQQIWKFVLNDIGINIIEMPALEVEVLSAQLQDGKICLWAKVYPESSRGRFKFEVVGTGWMMDSEKKREYIDTVQLPNGLVFHVFELSEE